jgi:hypothetical protein
MYLTKFLFSSEVMTADFCATNLETLCANTVSVAEGI